VAGCVEGHRRLVIRGRSDQIRPWIGIVGLGWVTHRHHVTTQTTFRKILVPTCLG